MTIACEICGAQVHIMKKHLQEEHPETSIEAYRETYPDAPLFSETAKERLKQIKNKEKSMADTQERKAFHEVFDIPKDAKGALNKKGKPIPIIMLPDSENEFLKSLVPDVDDNYIFNIDLLKEAIFGIEFGIPTYASGWAGTGKSTLFEQIAARTNRPLLRVQHSGNTEESHILGQHLARQGETYWEPGPLQLCMKYGITYLADEYDRGAPQVLSVYQPVLEGKPLITKEAPDEWRIVKPHPDFKFVATGNTNGAGDETGMFPSTMLQDFANYERFGLMLLVDWMPRDQEIAVVQAQGGIPYEDAKQLVSYANDIRKQVDNGQISAPISPRALINTARIGLRFQNYSRALELCYINRLGRADAEVCRQISQRMFGGN